MTERCSPANLRALQDCLYGGCPFFEECYEDHSGKGGLLDFGPGRAATKKVKETRPSGVHVPRYGLRNWRGKKR